jgi:hypothetical protein
MSAIRIAYRPNMICSIIPCFLLFCISFRPTASEAICGTIIMTCANCFVLLALLATHNIIFAYILTTTSGRPTGLAKQLQQTNEYSSNLFFGSVTVRQIKEKNA